MSDIVMPSLSEDGWVKTDARQADYLFSHFFLTDYSQTQLYLGQIASLAWIIQNTQGDQNRLISVTQFTLERYFSRYFTNVNVEVVVNSTEDTPNQLDMRLYVSFTGKDNQEYNLAHLAKIKELKISEVIKLNNYGAEDVSAVL